MTKSPRVVCTVAEYFLLESITVGGGVLRCSMQVTISVSQPGASEVGGAAPPPESHAAVASNKRAAPTIRLTAETLRDHLPTPWGGRREAPGGAPTSGSRAPNLTSAA